MFAVTNNGTNGLEFAPDFIEGQTWGCVGISVDPDNFGTTNGIDVAPGADSSDLIAAANCFAPAASAAFNYGPDLNPAVTANDWYLPSTDELRTIRDNPALGLPGATATAYWSSTEDSATNAFLVLIQSPTNVLDQGLPSTSSKEAMARVLPVRSF